MTARGPVEVVQTALKQIGSSVIEGIEGGGALIRSGIAGTSLSVSDVAASSFALTRDAAEKVIGLYAGELEKRALIEAQAEWALHNQIPWDEADLHRRDALMARHRQALNRELFGALISTGLGPAARLLRLPLPL